MNNDLPGAEYIGCDQSPQSGHRTSYPPGSFFDRASSDASRISVGADVGPIFVGAKSGFSTNMALHYDSKRGNGIWLCGTYSGPSTAGVVHAQNKP